MFDAMLRQLLYPAPPVPVPSPPPTPLREVALKAGGQAVSAWYHPPLQPRPAGREAVVLFLHGNGENLETVRLGGLFGALAGLGFGCLAIDYPGYGRSGGKPGQATLTAAALAGWQAMATQQPQARRLLMGWSLGAAVAAQLAAHLAAEGLEEPAGLALLSPWHDLASLAKVHFSPFLAAVGMPDTYDSGTALAQVRCPILVLHGADDELIPLSHAERLVAGLQPAPRLVVLPRVGHNDLLGRDRTWQALGHFFEEVLP